MWKQSENIVHRLFSRQISRGLPNTHTHRARELYENIVPSHTVYDVDCPDQWWRRFTNDGQYLICFSRSHQELLIYRPSWLSYCSTSEVLDELPARAKKFESYFTLLHQIPLATALNEAICKDFFLSTENNQYGVFATSTAPDSSAPVRRGAVAGVPSIEKITFFLVRLADGVVTDQRHFRDDYIHLAHNAGVFLHDDLLAVLSVRFQSIHILQVRENGLFLDVRTIGEFCREDDELLLNSQAQEEAKFQEEQARLRKTRGLVNDAEAVASVPQPSKDWGNKPWATLNSRRRPRPRDARAALDDPAPSGSTAPHTYSQSPSELYAGNHTADIDVLYDGYFRGLFTGGDGSVSEVNVPPRNGSNRIRIGGSYSGFESTPVRRFPTGEYGSSGSMPGYRSFGGEEYARYDTLGLRCLSGGEVVRYDNMGIRRASVSTSESLYSSSGSDTVSLSYGTTTGTTDPGSSDATTLHDFSSPSEDPGPSERRMRPVPSMSTSGRSMGAPPSRAGYVFGDEASLPGPLAGLSRSGGDGGDQGTASTAAPLGRMRLPGVGPGSVREAGTQNGRGGASLPEDALQQGGQILGGLKQRLLSFILQAIQDDDISPATKAQRLKRFYYHFQEHVDLVMWKVQFLDRYHLLIKFGSVDGVVQRNSEASHQTAFLAVYNLETTQMLGFYHNSSEELVQSVEHYCDHFRVAPQYPLYMNFISSYANNAFAREQLRKQKAACITSKGCSYAQVLRRTLASLPYNSQSQSPSAYFDQYLFHYDEKLISATDRHKPCMEHPIKFISRRRPNTLKFKINPGLELGSNDGHIKRVASFLFHPIFPFAISVQQSLMQTTIVNFHFRQ